MLGCLFSFNAMAQNVTISGTVKSGTTKEGISYASVSVSGSQQGTLTDATGAFKISVSRLPVVLIVSSVGFTSVEFSVDNAATPVEKIGRAHV